MPTVLKPATLCTITQVYGDKAGLVGRCNGQMLEEGLDWAAADPRWCTFTIKDSVVRGPMLLDADKTKALGWVLRGAWCEYLGHVSG